MVERSAKGRHRLRCAIYTRKSSEEGLEQEFNSLDAQREACEAFIASQRHEGWTLPSDRYDDGGLSGGTMERPALQRLLADIATSRIDIVVVYKVDRLTRALSDFARIVELFDRHNVSFVSVTQAFNTTTSMGRLTLNVLLSFAQFEREVTGERIRDKIAASKKKGMWMGGQPSLGYDVHNRKLVINETEAKTVRMIFQRYVELKSVRDLKSEVDAAGILSKARRAADGSSYGGQRFGRGALYAMLQNRIYRGEITHKGDSYPGEHQAIIEEALFEEVQSTLAANRTERVSRHNQDLSPLTGLLFDADGERLTPSRALKKGVRYRYYVSQHLITGNKNEARGMRLPARGVETLIRTRIEALLANPEELTSILPAQCDRAAIVSSAIGKARDFASLSAADLGLALNSFVSRISVFSDRVAITIYRDALAAWILGVPAAEEDDRQNTTIITAPIRVQQRGQEMRLVLGAEDGL